jgi:pyruvate/2-oxoglutarate dehydrogenase complex dihydrolipoamide dehydrogenase (E3) component
MGERDVEDVDLLVVGGGKAGKSLAMDRAKAGWSVVMVERDKIGGTCINVACIPTKALVGSARALLTARHAARMGVVTDGEPSISLDWLRQHKESVVDGMVAAHEQLFADSGMDFVLGTARFVSERTVEIRTRSGAGRIVRGRDVFVTGADGSQVRGQELLVATGRTPVTADLGLDTAGVEMTDRGYVRVDDHLRTSAEHVWAAGDVAGSAQFTHASWSDFRILRANLTGGDAVTTGRLMPYTVFVTPELARVGLTESAARAQGRSVKVATIPVAAIPRAKTLHDGVGTWKAVVDGDTDEILGAALLGHGAGEIISAVQLAILGGLPYQRVRDAVLTHPTMGEGLNLLFDALDDHPRRNAAKPTTHDIPTGWEHR